MEASEISSPLPSDIQVEIEAAKKLENFLSSLPKERAWLTSDTHLYNYQGQWIPASHLQGIIPFQNNFLAQDSDIFLVTHPKTGTTWLKAIIFAISNRVQYRVTSPQHPLLIRNPHDLVPNIDFGIYARNENPDLSCFKNPRLFSTHLPYGSLPQSVKDSGCKIVYLSRNPKDTFISMWHFINKMKGENMEDNSMEEMFERFCKGVNAYGPYWDHTLGFWKKSLEMDEKLCFLKYEDMKKEPLLYLKKLAKFLGCPFSLKEETSRVPEEILRLCSFDNLSNLDVNKNGKLPSGFENKSFFRRGEAGDWKNFLTEEMINRLDGITEEKFKASGLEF